MSAWEWGCLRLRPAEKKTEVPLLARFGMSAIELRSTFQQHSFPGNGDLVDIAPTAVQALGFFGIAMALPWRLPQVW